MRQTLNIDGGASRVKGVGLAHLRASPPLSRPDPTATFRPTAGQDLITERKKLHSTNPGAIPYMRLFLPLIALATTPLSAQSGSRLAPHPAPLLWRAWAPTPIPADTVRASTGAGTGTYVGAGLGALGGFLATRFFCGLSESDSCLTDELLGVALGGLVGAMAGSAFESK